MKIYNELFERVSNGETFHIDFEKRTMKVGKDYLIKDGEYDTSRLLFNNPDEPCPMKLVLGFIEVLYEHYKYSLPSERSDSKRRTYFKALPMEEIPDDMLFRIERREVAQASLEGFILCMILEGKFQWTEDMGSWFWQSKSDSDLVILRKWIERKGE
jgi:hypothetical protein